MSDIKFKISWIAPTSYFPWSKGILSQERYEFVGTYPEVRAKLEELKVSNHDALVNMKLVWNMGPIEDFFPVKKSNND